MAHQLTIRYDEALAREIEDLARREGLSRNQAVLRLLRKAAGLEERSGEKAVIGSSLDWFFARGTTSRLGNSTRRWPTSPDAHDLGHRGPL